MHVDPDYEDSVGCHQKISQYVLKQVKNKERYDDAYQEILSSNFK